MTTAGQLTAIFDAANRLLERSSLGSVTDVEPLFGGRNNRTFRITGPEGHWLLKQYFQDANALRNRFESEWRWSQFCTQQGVSWVPQAIARDEETHSSLFEYIDGRRLGRDEVSEIHVEQAAAFVAEVNRLRQTESAKSLPNAAEACFSLEEHLQCVNRRVQRLSGLTVQDQLDEELLHWLNESLLPTWQSITNHLKINVSDEQRSQELSFSHRCLSPSDFGFHNALITVAGKLYFFDFEYAGWDDPAKLVCDFFWQQDLPAPRHTKPRLIEAVSEPCLRDELESRIGLLTPVYGIKWCCLILNEFLAADRRRREFAQGSPMTSDRRAEQFERARRLLHEVQVNFAAN